MRRHIVVLTIGLCFIGCAHEQSAAPDLVASGNSAGGECERIAADAGSSAATEGALVARFDVGRRSLFVACQGSGKPTVVMETGFSDPGIVWGRALIRRVAEISRVCVYDRAGLGYSDPRPDPTDAGNVSTDLHALLSSARITPPYVLVGHSVGGMYARVFDHDHPGEVSGLVLVDSSHPDQFLRARERLGAADWAQVERSVESAWKDPAKEPSDWMRTSLLARQAGSLGDRPLHVLSHDPAAAPPCQGGDCLSPDGQATWEELWQELQTELAGVSSNTTHEVIAGSGHYIQANAPERVAQAIAQVVQAAR